MELTKRDLLVLRALADLRPKRQPLSAPVIRSSLSAWMKKNHAWNNMQFACAITALQKKQALRLSHNGVLGELTLKPAGIAALR